MGGGGVAGLRRRREVCAAEQSGGVDLGLGAALNRKVECRGCGVPNKGRDRGFWACMPVESAAEITARIVAAREKRVLVRVRLLEG